jgi:hypothetical protein
MRAFKYRPQSRTSYIGREHDQESDLIGTTKEVASKVLDQVSAPPIQRDNANVQRNARRK